MLKCGNCCHYFEDEYKKNGKRYTTCQKCRQYKREWMKDHKDYVKNYMEKYKSDDFEPRKPMSKDEYLLSQKKAKKKYQQQNWTDILIRNREYRETHPEETKQYQKEYRMMKKGLIDKVNVKFNKKDDKDENPIECEKSKDDDNDIDIDENDLIDFIKKCVKI